MTALRGGGEQLFDQRLAYRVRTDGVDASGSRSRVRRSSARPVPHPGQNTSSQGVSASSAARMVGDQSMSRPSASCSSQRSTTALASARAALSAALRLAPALMSRPRVRIPMTVTIRPWVPRVDPWFRRRTMIDPSSKAGREPKAAEEFFELARTANLPFMRAYYRRVAERYLSSQGKLKPMRTGRCRSAENSRLTSGGFRAWGATVGARLGSRDRDHWIATRRPGAREAIGNFAESAHCASAGDCGENLRPCESGNWITCMMRRVNFGWGWRCKTRGIGRIAIEASG